MTADTDLIAGQILDKLSDCVLGPAQGTLSATTASGTVVVLQGKTATLPDGRVVRVRKSTKVSTTATAVPCRLLHLAPAYPAKGNFAILAAGVTATWVTPPAGLVATATTSAFAANALACVGAVAEFDHDPQPGEIFGAGVNGGASFVLASPEIAFATTGNTKDRWQQATATWKLRATVYSLGAQKERRAIGRTLYDALKASLLGATAGSSQVAFTSWKRVQSAPEIAIWDLVFTTLFIADGRQEQAANVPAQSYSSLDATIPVNNDGGQPSPFTVETIV